MTRVARPFVLCLASALCVLSLVFAVGCQQVCDTVPTQRTASIRILNAMPDVPTLQVYLDGKLFQKAFYDISQYPDLTVDPDQAFGYHDAYQIDHSLLGVRHHRVVALEAPGDTVCDTTIFVTDHRQSFLFMGRHRAFGSQHPFKFVYLDDNTRTADSKTTLARFVHAIADLNGIDVYFSKNTKYDQNHKPHPDLTIDYGQVSDQFGGGSGTGRSASDYLSIPTANNDGLKITAKGDTSNVLILITTPFTHSGFFATIVVRGESSPLDHEPIVSSLVLEDGSQSQGTFNFSFETFGIRFVNATRNPYLTLLARGTSDQGVRQDIPLQDYVKYVQRDSASRYWPLTTAYHGTADFFISNAALNANLGDTSSWIYHFHRVSVVNTRYSFVAIDSTPMGAASASRYSVLVLTDSLSLPSNHAFGRVRFVNTSPDHVMHFTFNGQSYTLQQQDIAIADAPIGHYSVSVSDGSKSGVVAFNLPADEPMTVYFLPADSLSDFPFSTSLN